MNQIVKSNGIKFGLIMGILAVILTAAIYTIDISLFTSWWLGLTLMFVYLIIFIVALVSTKKQLNGVMTFKEAFTTYFLVALVGVTISTLFNYVLFNLVDPGAKETLADLTAKATSEMMAKFGAPQSEIDKALEGMEEVDNYSPANLAKGWIISILISAVFGLLFALIFRSKPAYKE